MSTSWQAAKAGGANPMMGIDGIKGVLADMSELGVWDTYAVKIQTLKTAIEVTDCPPSNTVATPTLLCVSAQLLCVCNTSLSLSFSLSFSRSNSPFC